MKREAGEPRAPGPPPSCSTSHLAVRAGPAVERAGACTCPPLPSSPPHYPCPHAEKTITKSRAGAHAERWLQQQPWIVFTTQSTRAAQPREKRTPRARPFFKTHNHLRQVSASELPRGCSPASARAESPPLGGCIFRCCCCCCCWSSCSRITDEQEREETRPLTSTSKYHARRQRAVTGI